MSDSNVTYISEARVVEPEATIRPVTVISGHAPPSIETPAADQGDDGEEEEPA